MGALLASMVRQVTALPASASRHSFLHLQSSLLHLLLASLDEDAHAPITRLESAKQYMKQRLDDPELSPLKVARHLGISLRSLARLFATEDSTPSRWLWNARLAQARQLLETGSTSNVTDVALACGFTSFSHFSRAFRQAHGVPPSTLRTPRHRRGKTGSATISRV
jgi:transcriptional regulator GlxA family with amidase domain